VALIAVDAVVHVTIHALVIGIGLSLRVAIRALEHREVVGILMAGGADTIGVAVSHREEGVVLRWQRGRYPGGRRMTGITGRRPRGRGVIRVVGAVVIGHVATGTNRWQRRVVIVDVATGAGHRGVRTSQREGRVVMVEDGVGPNRRVMAQIAGLREACRDVVWIVGSVVVSEVAGTAGRAGQLVVIVDVALTALRTGQVEPGQRPAGGGVIELAIRPQRRVVA
jgi:hypothetical protein